MLNVVATLQQRCGNVLITSESNVVTTSETDVSTTLIFDRVTTLWQRQQRRCNNVVTTSLCQLGNNQFSLVRFKVKLSRWRRFLPIITLKNKIASLHVHDLTNLNKAFYQLLNQWYFWRSFVLEKNTRGKPK